MYKYHVGVAGHFHLFWFGVFLPLLYVRSARKLAARDYPPRLKQFSVVILSLSSFVAISIPVAQAEYIDLWAKPNDWPETLFIGAAALMVIIVSMAPGWRREVEKQEWKLYYFMPRTPMEKVFWAGVSLFAGFGEEIVYSGVMFSLLWIMLDSRLSAVMIVAIVFAISHSAQGWKSMLVIFAFSICFQSIYYLTGSLYPGMVVHFLYDLTAGMMLGYWGEKLGYPIGGVPREKAVASAA